MNTRYFNALAILLAIFTGGFAQEKTFRRDGEFMTERNGGLGSLVVIPFEDRMYMSDADNDIGRETGLNPGEIMVKFRFALTESLEAELSKDWNIQSFYDETTKEKVGLEYIHSSVKYNYIPVSDKVMMANDTTLKKKDIQKQKGSKNNKSGLVEGQVVTYSDQTEKFMELTIIQDTLMTYLNRNMKSDYYLFINEFDIRHHVKDPDKIASGGLYYRLKIHFTCVNNVGEILVSGAATSEVQASSKNLYEIIRKSIPDVTSKLTKMIRKFKDSETK